MNIGLKYGTDLVVDTCETAWTGLTGFTTSADADKKVGSYAAKIVSAGTNTGLMGYHAVGSTDLSTYLMVQLWVKSSVALLAGELSLLLDNTAACASPLETLLMPELPANVWTIVTLTLSVPASDTAIISVGVSTTKASAFTVYLDDIRAVHGRAYDALSVRGFDDVDSIGLWPPISNELLDGSVRQKISSFYRNITVNFGVLSTKADRTFLVTAIISNDLSLVYKDEEVDVVLSSPQGFGSTWPFDVDFARSFSIDFREKNSRTTLPTSWA